jgi:hypothetical protein
MSKPLFTQKEQNAQKKKLAALEKSHGNRQNNPNFNFDTYWAEKKALEDAWQILGVRKAQARPDEFINALLVLVGERGAWIGTAMRSSRCWVNWTKSSSGTQAAAF